MELNILALAASDVYVAAFCGLVVVFCIADMWISAKYTKRTLLGRIFGYAPTSNTQVESLRQEIHDLIARKSESFQEYLIEIDEKRMETFVRLNKKLSKQLDETEMLKIVVAQIEMRELARGGANAEHLSEKGNISEAEAKAIHYLYK